MADHQTSIFEENTAHHLFLEFDLPVVTGPLPGNDLLATPIPRVYETFAFSERMLDGIDHRLVAPSLESCERFVEHSEIDMVANQGDMFLWIHGNQRDEVFARGLAWIEKLGEIAELKTEEHGFLYRDNRDLSGFIYGSANPQNQDGLSTALIPTGSHAGGSFVFTQKWLHDLREFRDLEVEQQEQVIGRTKKSSAELDADRMAVDSHVSRMQMQSIEIYRRSVPAGGLTDAGLFFLGFSAELQRFKQLLIAMFGMAPDGIRDRLLDYSQPRGGSFYFAPNTRALRRILV